MKIVSFRDNPAAPTRTVALDMIIGIPSGILSKISLRYERSLSSLENVRSRPRRRTDLCKRAIVRLPGWQYPGYERDAHARREVLAVGTRGRATADTSGAARAAALGARGELHRRGGVELRGPERRHRRGAERQRGAGYRQLLLPAAGTHVAATGVAASRGST